MPRLAVVILQRIVEDHSQKISTLRHRSCGGDSRWQWWNITQRCVLTVFNRFVSVLDQNVDNRIAESAEEMTTIDAGRNKEKEAVTVEPTYRGLPWFNPKVDIETSDA